MTVYFGKHNELKSTPQNQIKTHKYHTKNYFVSSLRSGRAVAGDRENSKLINSLPGFENTIHEIYTPKYRTFTEYYGDNKANNPSEKSYFDSN